MDIFLHVIFAWVLRALQVKEEDVVKPEVKIIAEKEMKELACASYTLTQCDINIYVDYENKIIYIINTLKYGENVDSNAEVVFAMSVFVIMMDKRDPPSPTKELAAYKKALELAKLSKKTLLKFLVV